jgi:hypothetical protein
MFAMFAIATSSGSAGSGLYAKGQNTSQHGRCINSMFVLLRSIAGLFMIYYLGVCVVYVQTEDDAPKSSALTAYHDSITTDDVDRAGIANATEPWRCTTVLIVRLRISWMGREIEGVIHGVAECSSFREKLSWSRRMVIWFRFRKGEARGP